MKSLIKKLFSFPTYGDVLILAVFAALITWNPHFAHGKINIFEVGLYLPGIQSILNGEIPYRDFFHLRGPFELYMPAVLMKMFGVHLKTLYAYFYFGNVLCLVMCILIAKELFQTKYILYLMTPVLIGRAWPRVVYAYWGGMRYAFGLMAIWLVIKFFRENKLKWMLLGGIASAFGLFTSVEMGIYPILGVVAALIVSIVFKVQETKSIFKGFGAYCIGLCIITVPFVIYLATQSALLPYIDSVITIVTRMQIVIDPHVVSVYPRNFMEAVVAMTNPNHTNFKHMTPSYLYIFILVYLVRRLMKRKFSSVDLMVICLGIYGFVMYNTGFRGIWAAQFEMSLQPEKILLFYLLEVILFASIAKKETLVPALKSKPALKWYSRDKWQLYCINTFMFVFLLSSVGYPIQRYNHRFFAFKFARDKILGKSTEYLDPASNARARALTIDRADGIIVPDQQADELEQVSRFVQKRLSSDEILFTYPETGTYNFLFNRRAFGKYPLATFTWFNDDWHDEYLEQLRSSKPKFVIVEKDLKKIEDEKSVYGARPENRKKYRDIMNFIAANYRIDTSTALSNIYTLK